MNQISQPARQYGFRFSLGDALILLLGLGMAGWLHSVDFPLWWIVPVAVGHFFLFCNVFLVWRRLEMIWAAVFVLNAGAHIAFGRLACGLPMLVQLPVTLWIIFLQMRSPWYHGILARRINPRLDDYLNGRL